jgi:diadenosine tetraphosphate (Ap4A) HIT family hydrolase
VPETSRALPDFASWPSFPFEGNLRIKPLDKPVDIEPPRMGEDPAECTACSAPDEAYIYVNERWRVRAMDRPSGLPMVLILESRSHLDLGDLPNMLAAELGVMTVRLERAVRSLDGVARVHVNRWGDGSAHLHLWFLARPYGRLQLRGTFLSLWDDILPAISEAQWRENLALVAAWLAEFGGTPLAQPPRIDWKAPSSLAQAAVDGAPTDATEVAESTTGAETAVDTTSDAGAATTAATENANKVEPAPTEPGAEKNGGSSAGAEPTVSAVVPEAATTPAMPAEPVEQKGKPARSGGRRSR